MNTKQKLSYAASQLNYDPDTGWFTWKEYRGKKMKAGDRAGSVNGKGYRQIKFTVNGKSLALLEHRIAWYITQGEVPEQIDHINGVCNDNRIANLRACTLSQNQYNSSMRKDNSSGVKGVYWSRPNGRWRAQIRINGKNKYLGLFKSLCEAEAVIKAKREELHGCFANHGEVVS